MLSSCAPKNFALNPIQKSISSKNVYQAVSLASDTTYVAWLLSYIAGDALLGLSDFTEKDKHYFTFASTTVFGLGFMASYCLLSMMTLRKTNKEEKPLRRRVLQTLFTLVDWTLWPLTYFLFVLASMSVFALPHDEIFDSAMSLAHSVLPHAGFVATSIEFLLMELAEFANTTIDNHESLLKLDNLKRLLKPSLLSLLAPVALAATVLWSFYPEQVPLYYSDGALLVLFALKKLFIHPIKPECSTLCDEERPITDGISPKRYDSPELKPSSSSTDVSEDGIMQSIYELGTKACGLFMCPVENASSDFQSTINPYKINRV